MSERTPQTAGDDSEIEVSDLDAAGCSGPARPLPGLHMPPRVPRTHRLRIVVLATVVTIVLVVLGVSPLRVAVLARLGSSIGTRTSTPPAGHPAPSSALPPPLVDLPAPPLAAPPANCPAPPAFSTVTVPFFGPAIGFSPIYVVGLHGQPLTLHLGGPDGRAYTQYGWLAQIVWAMAPGFAAPATISVSRLSDGQALLLTSGPGREPATSAVLQPAASAGISTLHAQWNEWLGMLFLPDAGCYTLRVAWPGGGWSIPFAAGR
jgi:hypothetical protein